MQSYLGEYPGARTNPEMKFIRAVYSMIGQSDPNWELIIAADGCKITERLYKEHFQHYSNIKFFMVEKPENTLMGEEKYHRGKPRAVAVKNATGDWISYLDSDDVYIKDAIKTLRDIIVRSLKINNNLKCLLNNCVFENDFELVKWKKWNKIKKEGKLDNIDFSNEKNGDVLKIDGLDGNWVPMSFRNKNGETKVPLGTYSLIHKKGYPSWEWGDTTEEGEDGAFIRPMLKEGFTGIFETPIYIRCHGVGWDL